MWKTPKILIVEDEPRLRNILTRELREEGFFALSASDGDEALKVIRDDSAIELVLLDILIPGESALVVYDTIRKEKPRISIIISSSYSREEQSFLFHDADGYYCKDEPIEKLLNQMHQLLSV
jgi:DNA-binding response OmpR family regulator